MKKTILNALLLLLASAFLTACDDPYADQFVADPTVNEQEVLFSTDGFTLDLGSELKSALELKKEDLEQNRSFEVVKTTAVPQLAENATLKFKVEVSDSEDFDKVLIIPSVSENNSAKIGASDLNETVKTLYGKAPFEREVYFRITTIVVDGDISAQLPKTKVLGPAKITPVAMVIETEYYLIGDINGWSFDKLDEYKFNHSGKDVYEDPHFSILVNNVEGYFKIVPKSSKDADSWDGVLGNPVDGNTELEGELVIDNSQAMRVTEPGWVKIHLNMLEYSYSIEIIGEMNLSLYVPGGYQGWSPDTAPTVYSKNLDFKYEGYVYFKEASEFKFASQPNWDGPNYGDGGDGTLSEDGGAGNLNVTEAGYYKLNVDLSGNPYTYSVTKTDWGLIGDATPGGWNDSTPMTYDSGTKVWSATATLTTGEYKFRANNGWDINLGGDLNNLSYGGDNMKINEAGSYRITLDLSNPEIYKASIVKQ